VNRINYARTHAERIAGMPLPAGIIPSLRTPLAALGLALAATGGVWGWETARFGAAARAADAVAVELDDIEPRLVAVHAAQRDLARLRAEAQRIAEVARTGARAANDVATLGDALPADAWLTSLRFDGVTLSLDGRGSGVDAVTQTLHAMESLSAYRAVRLTSLHADAPRPGVVYGVTLERAR
jgi:Tfp pilus assembly protein PilN